MEKEANRLYLKMAEKMKQVPFRYPEEFEESLDFVRRSLPWKKKINPTLIESVEIVARLIKALEKFTSAESRYYYNDRNKLNDLIKQLEKISKKTAGKKDIKNLDLKIDIKKQGVKKSGTKKKR